MKPLLSRHFRPAAALLAITFLAACSKKDDATPAPGISCTVDGSSLNVSGVSADVSASTIIQLTGYRSFTTPTSTGSSAVIFLAMPKKVGTYALRNNNGAASAAYADNNNGQLYLDTTGTITVASLTATTITGTFSFMGANPFKTADIKTITNGQFNVSF